MDDDELMVCFRRIERVCVTAAKPLRRVGKASKSIERLSLENVLRESLANDGSFTGRFRFDRGDEW